MSKAMNPIPATLEGWLKEIAAAYDGAAEAIPFGAYVDQQMGEEDLFHLAPSVCLKFRGLRSTRAILKNATEAALSSYVASKETVEDERSDPRFTFAFCYVASHFGLELITENEASRVLDFIETNREQLIDLIESA
jgi:hypothetical protein